MRKQHVITLTPAQRAALRRLVRRDATTALEQRRARILLASDAGAGIGAAHRSGRGRRRRRRSAHRGPGAGHLRP